MPVNRPHASKLPLKVNVDIAPHITRRFFFFIRAIYERTFAKPTRVPSYALYRVRACFACMALTLFGHKSFGNLIRDAGWGLPMGSSAVMFAVAISVSVGFMILALYFSPFDSD
jgi:hypothetical protein